MAGKTYWLDPTITFQRGSLAAYYDPPYARALVLREGSHSLAQIPPPARDAASTTVNQVYTVRDYSMPALFVVTTVYRRVEADAMRYRLSSQSLEEFGKENLNYYANEVHSIRPDGLPKVDDDQNANTITVTEAYTIDNLWNEPQHYFFADQIYGALVKPGIAKRSTPFEINYPLAVTETIDINLPQTVNLPSDSDTIADEALRLDVRQSVAGRTVRLEYSLTSLQDHVPAEKISKHLDTIERMRNSVGLGLPRGNGVLINTSSSIKPVSLSGAFKLLLLPLTIVLLVIGFKLRARASRVNQPVKRRAGDAPETAISIRTLDDITRHLAKLKCTCGASPYKPEAPPLQERFTYDSQQLTGVRMKCGDCGQFMDLYFKAQPGGSGLAAAQ